MPRLNIKNRKRGGWYHLYNQGSKRGRSRPREVFVDREDKRKFLTLLARHLGNSPRFNARGRQFVHMRAWIVLLAYCVMTTHFHLIVWQRDPAGIQRLMNRVKGDYTVYFNRKYNNTAPLFNGPVQAKLIDSRSYFKWLVAYVHKNCGDDENYEFSSHRAWIDPQQRPGWVDPELGLKVFGGAGEYLNYLKTYDSKRQLDQQLGHGRPRSRH